MFQTIRSDRSHKQNDATTMQLERVITIIGMWWVGRLSGVGGPSET